MGLTETIKRILTGKTGAPREVWKCRACSTTYDVVQEICTQCGTKSIVKLDEDEARGVEIDITAKDQNSDPSVGPGMGE